MTMHLLKPHFTTTRYSNKSRKTKTKKQTAAELEHQKFLNKMGVVRTERKPTKLKTEERESSRDRYESVSVFDGTSERAVDCSKKEQKTYSGDRKLLGIATTHKSNMVPVFADRKQDAVDISNMRR